MKTLSERFWEKVDKNGSCWLWLGSVSSGYGRFSFKGESVLAHRVSWFLAHDFYPPKDKEICHSCDNPACVNPSHLWIGTHTDNMKDCKNKRRNSLIRPVGENHGNARLKDREVIEIRNSSEKGVVLARRYKVSTQLISKVRKNEIWKHLL